MYLLTFNNAKPSIHAGLLPGPLRRLPIGPAIKPNRSAILLNALVLITEFA